MLPEVEALCHQLQHNAASLSSTERRLALLELRRLNRELQQTLQQTRRQLTDLKTSMDTLDTGLVCLRYEREHLSSQIDICRNTTHLFTTLLPELDEFSPSGNDANVQAALETELNQRKALDQQLRTLLSEKRRIEQTLAQRKLKLEELRNTLQSTLKGAKPVAALSKFDWEEWKKAHHMALEDKSVASADVSSTRSEASLTALFDHLVLFVGNRTDLRLRLHEAAADVVDSEYSESAQSIEPQVLEPRHSQIPKHVTYLQITLVVDDSFNVDIYIRSSPQFLIVVEPSLSSLIPSPWSSTASFPAYKNWLSFVSEPLEVLLFPSEENWVAAAWLQDYATGELSNSDLSGFFDKMTRSLLLRKNLASLVGGSEILNLVSTSDELLIGPHVARCSILSIERAEEVINWLPLDPAYESITATLNQIGLKYRALTDCLAAQIKLIQAQ